MALYATVNPSNVVTFVCDYSPTPPANVFPVVVDTQPAFDPSTQQLKATYTFETTQVRQGWAVVALSQDAQNDIADRASLATQAQAAYTALKAHTATTNQTQNILAIVLRYVARQEGITLT